MTGLKLMFLALMATIVSADYPVGDAGASYGVPSQDFSGYSGGYDQGSNNYGYDHGHGEGHGDEHHEAKPYEFGYSVKDPHHGTDFGQQEASDGHNVKGQYRVALPDGRTQIVTYHADWKTGFHADVKYEGEARYPEPTHGHNGGYQYPAPQSDYTSADFGGHSGGYSR